MRAKYFFLLGMILFIVPSVFSFNCEYFTGIIRDDCVSLNDTGIIASLIYTNHTVPDFHVIDQYNSQIVINTPPDDAVLHSGNYIQNAWISIIDVSPSIMYENVTYVPNNVTVWTEYGYNVHLPNDFYASKRKVGQTCSVTYTQSGSTTVLSVYSNGVYQGNNNKQSIIVTGDSIISVTSSISVSIAADFYVWGSYCDVKSVYCTCDYQKTVYYSDSITVQDGVNVKYYASNNVFDATIIGEYHNTTKGIIIKDADTSIILRAGNSSYSNLEFEYYATFHKPPYNVLGLDALRQKNVQINNLYIYNYTFYTYNVDNCSITGYSFFNQSIKPCITNISAISSPATFQESSIDLTFIIMIGVFIIIIYIVYACIKHYWGRYILLLLIFIPGVLADDCGLTNLASCIPQKIYDYTINLLNAPLQPLLSLMKNLLSNSPSITLFGGIWAIIIYCLSIFYSFLIMYAGVQFIFSGHDIVKRELAKEWLKNTIIMIVLIQASYYLYELILNVSAIMTSGILSMVDPSFFQLTADNLANVGLELIFTLLYVLVLVITILYLTLRYLMVCIGIILFPIGIFCYFVPPLKSYGRLIINLLGMLVFVTIIDVIVILACSKMIDISLFQNFKILLMITSLIIIDIIAVILAWHILTKTGVDDNAHAIGEAIKYIGMI